MQTITPHQLQHIDQFLLEHYRLYYIDLRAEVVDHMATDIEAELQVNKNYEEAFVLVIAKWDALLKPAKGFFRGIPYFVAQQWIKERFKRGGQACLFGVLTTLLFAGLFYDIVDLDEDFFLGLGVLALLFISCGTMYLMNFSLIQNTPLHTATGTFLRIEFKRLGMIQSTFIIIGGLSRLRLLPNGDWYFYTYLLMGISTLFYLIQWRMDYKKERLYQIKWQML